MYLRKQIRDFYCERKKPEVPEGLLCKCKKCGAVIVAEDVRRKTITCAQSAEDISR